jgi:predicted DNA-binding transcriptional regulator YafY
MADSAAVQLKRVLSIIPQFADDQDYRIDDIVERAGTTRDQLLKDFHSISERYDMPGGFIDCVTILVEADTVSMTAQHFHRPMRLTMSELCALELGLCMLRMERTPPVQAVIDTARARLRETITKLPTNDAYNDLRHAALSAAGSTEHLATLRNAVREHRAVVLRYRAGGSTESSERTVCPQAVVYVEQMWYVVSLNDDKTLRFYRLDRVEDVTPHTDVFEPDETVLGRVIQEGRAFGSQTEYRMTVRYSPRIARWIAERAGVPLDSDGGLTLEHPVADESWAVRHVLQYGPEAELIAPPELRQALVTRLQTLASAM